MPLRTRGFTLVEVMIVCVVVAVLAAIALPAYQDQVRKSRRASAQAFLMDAAAKEQTYLLDTRATYAGAATCNTTGFTTLSVTPPQNVTDFYDVCVSQDGGPPPTFTVQATPKNAQTADLGGQSLTLTNAGVKGPCRNNSTGAYTAAPCGSGTTATW